MIVVRVKLEKFDSPDEFRITPVGRRISLSEYGIRRAFSIPTWQSIIEIDETQLPALRDALTGDDRCRVHIDVLPDDVGRNELQRLEVRYRLGLSTLVKPLAFKDSD